MGDVVKFRRRRGETVRGAARKMLTEAMDSVGTPHAVVIVVLGADGRFAHRLARTDDIRAFDAFARAGALLDREKMEFMESDRK